MYRNNFGLLGLPLLVCLILGCNGCKGNEPANGGGGTAATGGNAGGSTIRVGEYGSMTGEEAAFGQSTHDGIMLAIDEINKGGGIDGKQVEIVGPEDTESNSQKAEIAVKRLIEKKVIAVLGEVASSRSLAGGGVCQQAQIPMISPSSTNPKVTEVGDYIFRVCFIDPFQGTVMAKFALSKGWKNVAVLTDVKQDYAVGLAEFFVKHFTANGGKITKE